MMKQDPLNAGRYLNQFSHMKLVNCPQQHFICIGKTEQLQTDLLRLPPAVWKTFYRSVSRKVAYLTRYVYVLGVMISDRSVDDLI